MLTSDSRLQNKDMNGHAPHLHCQHRKLQSTYYLDATAYDYPKQTAALWRIHSELHTNTTPYDANASSNAVPLIIQ